MDMEDKFTLGKTCYRIKDKAAYEAGVARLEKEREFWISMGIRGKPCGYAWGLLLTLYCEVV